MHPTEPPFLRIQFYLTAPYPCSYLDGWEARSQVATPAHLIGPAAYSRLIQAGFRRSGHYTYRPHCNGCKRCVPVRVRVEEFSANRSQRRCQMLNHALVVASQELVFDAEHFDLYRRYQSMRHAGGGMDQDDSDQYSQFLLSSQVKSNLLEFRLDGKLVMVSLIDQVQDGLSAVYTFFEPELSKRGLGTYSVLWLIDYARKLGLPYLYLGYWIKDSRKMAYKSNFRPLEVLRDNEWTVL
ncbi:MAG: arginyltransferase [Hydrogenophilaceae bacterium]|nr:arginyltransferase [Hydrogenophilaceae bacterium]